MSATGGTAQVVVGLHRALEPWLPEVKYSLGTLLEVAGFTPAWRWFTPGSTVDVYYGPAAAGMSAAVLVPWNGLQFGFIGPLEPEVDDDGADPGSGLRFPNSHIASAPRESAWTFSGDIVFGAFWLLTAPYEMHAPRSRRDDLDLAGAFVVRQGLLGRPLVSEWATRLRDLLASPQRRPVPSPWGEDGRVGFVFTHDVDYPEIIPWIEAPRLVASGRPGAWRLAADVVRGRSHYWTFTEWVDFERELGARGTYFFMARRGSLAQYAMGTPDDFYDVESDRFRGLFAALRDAGCEVGLHASYHAHRSAATLRAEAERIARASGAEVRGNRHHYWHLDPDGPYETLRKHEYAGFQYDCSLGLEYYPGFRRGVAHPFAPWHQGERRAINVLQLPTAWMDDHFDRRLARNGVTDADATAARLVEAARSTRGLVVVDYHSRGMNADIYPRYGPWLQQFVRQRLGAACFATAAEAAAAWLDRRTILRSRADDQALPERAVLVATRAPDAAVSGVQVGRLTPSEAPEWERYVAGHDARTPYHTLAWRAVTEEGLGHTACHLRATDGTGRIVGVLPLFDVRGLGGHRLVSVPMRDRGGVLASSPQVAVQLIEAALEIARQTGADQLELRQLEPLGPEVTRRLDVHVANHWVTTRVDLSAGRDTIWKRLDKDSVRWAIRKAAKQGVVVEDDPSPEGMDTFYDLFARTRHGMGIPPYPREFFRAIHRHMVTAGLAELQLVRCGTDLIGGLVSVMSPPHLILPAYAAPQNAWRRHYPSEAAFWHSMSRAADSGYRIYDFGADSPSQLGLLFFKRKWGGVHRFMSSYVWREGGGGSPPLDSTSPRYALARRAWRLLPGPVSRSLGGWLTRRMS